MAHMVAPMTGLRGIGRIHKHQRHTSGVRLVGHKLPQLVEAPAMVAIPLLLAELGPLSNARQVFEGNLALCRLGFLDELLADPVVNRSHMALLSPRQPFQQAFGLLCAFGLERTPHLGVVGTQLMDLSRFLARGIGIDRHTASAQINTERAVYRQRSWGMAFELDMQQERAITPFHQCRAGRRLAFQPSFLVVAQGGLKPNTAVEQCQTERSSPTPEN